MSGQKEQGCHRVPWILQNLFLTPFLPVGLRIWDAAGKSSWRSKILREGQSLVGGRAKSLERGIMGSVLHEKVLCVPALGIRTDVCQGHCYPAAAALV